MMKGEKVWVTFPNEQPTQVLLKSIKDFVPHNFIGETVFGKIGDLVISISVDDYNKIKNESQF